MDQMFREMDTDRSGTLDLHEFCTWMKNHEVFYLILFLFILFYFIFVVVLFLLFVCSHVYLWDGSSARKR